MPDSNTPVLVQGITGREGSYWTERMLSYGTRVVAGVTPGKGGQSVLGLPVYDSVTEAARHHEVEISVLFVPALLAKEAALEAMEAGIRQVIVLADGVPMQDTMEMLAHARNHRVRVLGPNCPGIVIPGQALVGIMPAWLSHIFRQGHVGVISRSGSLGNAICYYIAKAGLGQSAFIGIGGDPIVGTTFVDALHLLEGDPNTHSVVMVGEVGGNMEEDATSLIPQMSKRVVAFIAGANAPEGKRMGHAGAIVQGNHGTAEGKIRALEESGAAAARLPSQVGELLK